MMKVKVKGGGGEGEGWRVEVKVVMIHTAVCKGLRGKQEIQKERKKNEDGLQSLPPCSSSITRALIPASLLWRRHTHTHTNKQTQNN